jgi:hypothetical protein
MPIHEPEWLRLQGNIAPSVFTLLGRHLRENQSPDLTASLIPDLAAQHLLACLNASIAANRSFEPSVAMCLLRQCVESLTIVDVGMQSPGTRDPLLQRWNEGRVTAGGLRKELATIAWPRYGSGVWGESWEVFFSELAKAVHPYAHYSSQLMGWQLTLIPNEADTQLFAMTATFDPLKASRLSLLHSLVVWTVARILLTNSQGTAVKKLAHSVGALGKALATSNLVTKSGDWASELTPHMYFKPGVSWQDA